MDSIGVITELYRAFREKDDEAFRRICRSDLVWVQNKGFPGGGTYLGAEAVIENVFRAFSNEWESFGFEIGELLAGSDFVVVTGRYVGRSRATGREMESDACHVYALQDGKIRSFRQYADTKRIWDAMG